MHHALIEMIQPRTLVNAAGADSGSEAKAYHGEAPLTLRNQISVWNPGLGSHDRQAQRCTWPHAMAWWPVQPFHT